MVMKFFGTQFMFMPHMPGLLQRPLGQTGPSACFGPAAWAANVENSWLRCCWPHDGHSTPASSGVLRTSFSNFVPQSWHLYS
jgi:hypothetical protein